MNPSRERNVKGIRLGFKALSATSLRSGLTTYINGQTILMEVVSPYDAPSTLKAAHNGKTENEQFSRVFPLADTRHNSMSSGRYISPHLMIQKTALISI